MIRKLLSLLFQMMFSLDIADMATAILVLSSFIEVLSLFMVDPSYFNESTS